MKHLIVFDLDGTLAASKASLDHEMAALLVNLLQFVKVAVISGGDWPQFEQQILANLPQSRSLTHLSLLPTCGTKFYRYDAGWTKIYSEEIDSDQKVRILQSIEKAIRIAGVESEATWGEQVEDRGSQITFSALGQQAPLEQKQTWDPDFTKRQKMKVILEKLIPDFSVRLGGTTSLDITKPGLDKAYGIRKLRELLRIPIAEMIFVGDAIFPGGNDYPVQQAGVVSIRVRDPNESKRVIEAILACLSDRQPQLQCPGSDS